MNDLLRSKRLGIALLVAGIVLVLVGVFTVLNASTGDGDLPRTFERRRSYNQVKVAVHAALPQAGAFAAAGLLVAILGGRMLGRALVAEREGGGDDRQPAPGSPSSRGPQERGPE